MGLPFCSITPMQCEGTKIEIKISVAKDSDMYYDFLKNAKRLSALVNYKEPEVRAKVNEYSNSCYITLVFEAP